MYYGLIFIPVGSSVAFFWGSSFDDITIGIIDEQWQCAESNRCKTSNILCGEVL